MKKTLAARSSAPQQHPSADELIKRFLSHLTHSQGRAWDQATPHDQSVSLALAVRDLLFERTIATQRSHAEGDVKRVYYLSMEYLLGQLMRCNLVNLGLYDSCRTHLAELGLDLEALCEAQPDPGLGNGGLGRLAACLLDSLATLELPAIGYGIRYDYGIFEQDIVDGWQVERPEYWLRFGSPWEIMRPEFTCPVRLYGRVEQRSNAAGDPRPRWVDYQTILGLPYDISIPGYRCGTANLLRLWSARASESFDLAAFNRGGYIEAIRQQALTENISRVLYPNDNTPQNRDLRLLQEYFFVACTLGDILRRHDKQHNTLAALPDKATIQLNDTHPALAIAEFMRILVDERELAWDDAWELCCAVFNYTNHTLLPEALETWPVAMFERLLPRHLQIIYEINRRFLQQVQRRWPGDLTRVQRMSLIQEAPEKAVRMAHVAIVGSNHVNGVARLHTELIRTRLVPDFAQFCPEKFSNKTNGVTPRRWLLACNPGWAAAITERIGDGWPKDLQQLRQLEPLADDAAFQEAYWAAKHDNKRRLASWIGRKLAIVTPIESMFDVQVKRLHEYKRQLLNILQVIVRYQTIIEDGAEPPPRVVLFGAKAAPAYSRAKLIIKLINDVARTINADARVGERLRVVFLPNYRVSLAEKIIPAADLSEQISTAGMEASGTGNMKFAMNGALTIGTLDGANIEIRQLVGQENFFLFGLTADQIARQRPSHKPWEIYQHDPLLRRALDAIRNGAFSPRQPDLFKEVFDWLTAEGDHYMLLADAGSYLATQARVDDVWQDPRAWARMAILNVARIGYFSSDRTVQEYAQDIWHLDPFPVPLIRRDDAASLP